MAWSVVVPVKTLDVAKSRLRHRLDGVADLALAFALDTVAAAQQSRSVARVVLVTNDDRVRAAVPAGVQVVSDPGRGLNPAVSAGLRYLGPGWAAVLTADLPGLTGADVDAALAEACRFERSMVTDHSGQGTTLLAGRALDLHPQFGAGSRRRHEGRGHTVLDVPLSSPLRWDVDTPGDLAHLLRGGVGPETTRVIAALEGRAA